LIRAVTALDVAIVAFTAALGIWGYRQGLIVGAMSLLGFGLGALLGSRLAPLVLEGGSGSPYTPLLAALGALIGGAMVAVTLETYALGLRARLIRSPHLHVADGAGGAMLVACIALGVVWVFGAVALHAPGTRDLREDVQRSLILRSLNSVMPPSGPVLNALDRVDPAPSIVGPAPPLERPDPSIATDGDVLRAGRSVVRVLGSACGLGIEGSGWVAAPGLVVTNAHVVAGEDDTSVETQSSASLAATVVHYEPENDLAILRIGAALPVLPAAPDAQRGQRAAILGYPENGPYAVAPARFGETRDVVSEDSYGRGPVTRPIASLRGSVLSGNSGGPLVDSRGRVMGTIFATTTYGHPGGFAIPEPVIARALDDAETPVDTGPCTG
jgi:S1-C subfamily serine protease